LLSKRETFSMKVNVAHYTEIVKKEIAVLISTWPTHIIICFES
jgi:hypothetical protein